MADLYVRSTDGNNADNGTTWALAKATWAGAGGIESAGDTIWFSQAHSESTASAVTVAISGTAGSPTRMLCGNDGAEPPTALDTTALIATTGASAITLNTAAALYVYGLNLKAGSGAVSANLNISAFSNKVIVWEECGFEVAGTTGGSVNFNSSGGVTRVINGRFKFGATNSLINSSSGGTLVVEGGSVLSGSANITNLFTVDNVSLALITGFDLSNLHTGVNLFAGGNGGRATIRNSKLPASWTGSVAASTNYQFDRFSLYNCDSGDTNYRLWIEAYAGSIKQETTIVMSGGASDGTTAIAWRMASNASAKLPTILLVSDEIMVWNETVGSAVTATIEVVHDSQGSGTSGRLKDDEMWVEVTYLGTSGYPLSSRITDFKASMIASGANQADSTATWTTTGLSSPIEQKLEVTFTPQEKGFVIAKVCIAKASAVVYVDPAITVA
jgi:hypothetical protein